MFPQFQFLLLIKPPSKLSETFCVFGDGAANIFGTAFGLECALFASTLALGAATAFFV
jgi:hypothetical protein